MSRISDLRRRRWPDDADSAVVELTEALKTSGGTQTARPIQAISVREFIQTGGLLMNGRVGCGKTLVAAILATLYEDRRPLMLVPGGHVEKTDREIAAYRQHWALGHQIQIVSYGDISRDVDERLLRTYAPGVIVADECDKLRRVQGSGVARRISEYMAANPSTQFAAMTGTLFKEGLKDWGHLANWALKDKAPIPRLPIEIDQWHRGLKGERGAWPAMHAQLGTSGCVKEAFRNRIFESEGVVISIDQFTGVPLTLETVALDTGLGDVLERLYQTGETPDGLDTLDDPSGDADDVGGTWAAERQLALGFYYRPDTTPPVAWAMARKGYFRLVRRMLGSPDLNTELQVRRECERTQNPTWLHWKTIQPTFEPTFVPVWLNSRAIEYCKGWGRDGGIIWTDHRAFASRLSAETGWRWFSGGGVDATGLPIEMCTDQTIIASRQACGTGRNLQRWSRGLITATPANGRDFEQLLGRQHREGQERPVEMSILFGCRAHANDLRKVMSLSEEESEEMGRSNKILTCAWR